jgi:hypothetical protein
MTGIKSDFNFPFPTRGNIRAGKHGCRTASRTRRPDQFQGRIPGVFDDKGMRRFCPLSDLPKIVTFLRKTDLRPTRNRIISANHVSGRRRLWLILRNGHRPVWRLVKENRPCHDYNRDNGKTANRQDGIMPKSGLSTRLARMLRFSTFCCHSNSTPVYFPVSLCHIAYTIFYSTFPQIARVNYLPLTGDLCSVRCCPLAQPEGVT